MSINGKNVDRKNVFLGSNLDFTWGLGHDHDIGKKYEKTAKHNILFNFINNTRNLKSCIIKSMRVVKWQSITIN